jgi:predicted metal-dependent phosphoesterase TrpH
MVFQMPVNADLHCHSRVSDGTLAPAAVARRAAAHGVTMWALTDHDELGGQDEARAAAQCLGMRYVAGVEISVTWANQTVHIVGLDIDPHAAPLVDGLASTRGGREARAREIGNRLAEMGVPGAFEGALRHAANADMISRTHFARYMIETGHAASTQEVFNRYLADGKPACVPHRWAALTDALAWIRAAGGVAVIAHPGRYNFTALQFDALFGEFRDLGGLAIEVVTGSHTPDQYASYADVARRYGFQASRGSDFHDPVECRADLGSLPQWPADLVPVWTNWS